MSTSTLFCMESALEQACKDAQLEDFGDMAFTEALAQLCKYGNELQWTEFGGAFVQEWVNRWLVNRLRYHDDIKKHPEILEEDVKDPIIILGMPRCGTTVFQRFLSSDPNNFLMAQWMGLNPAPFPGDNPADPAPRIAYATEHVAKMTTPEYVKSHEFKPEDGEEDAELLMHGIDYIVNQLIFFHDDLLDWFQDRTALPAYQYEYNMLQYLQWQRGGKQGRQWVLKGPAHLGYMDEVSTVFPNAIMINQHRDLTTVLPSWCRTQQSLYEIFFVDLDPKKIAEHALKFWGPKFKRQAEQCSRLQGKLDIVDVPYLDVLKNPFDVAEMLYARAGRELTQEGRDAMQQWLDGNTQHKHGKPKYSMEEYGLTVDAVKAAFGTLDDNQASMFRP